MHSRCLDFFLLSFGWGGGGAWGEDFFSFSLCSLYVRFKFSMSSHEVLNMFPKFSICSPRVFPRVSLCFAQSPHFLTYIGGQKGEALHLSIESSILGASIVSTFFCDGPIKITHCKKKKKLDLLCTPN